MRRKKILWLASWYPVKADQFNGDFIERQARAVSTLHDVTLIHALRDNSMPPGKMAVEYTVEGRMHVYVAYYGAKSHGLFSRWASTRSYLHVHKKLFDDIRESTGTPNLVHVQVAWRAGLIALWLKRKFRIPYVLSEHWSGYSGFLAGNINTVSAWRKWLTKKILRNASCCMPVSASLGNSMENFAGRLSIQPVSNTVDTNVFFPASTVPPLPIRFVHASMMGPEKKVLDIIHACQQLHERGLSFTLTLVGPTPNEIIEYCKQKDLLNNVILIEGLKTYAGVAESFRNAHVLVLNSVYETQSCVMLEALCCGLPVVAPAVGGIPETVNEKNGILFEPGGPSQLAGAMQAMADKYKGYDCTQIAKDAANAFGYAAIAQSFGDVYDQVLRKKIKT